MEQQRRFKILDTGPGFTWSREWIAPSTCASRAQAQEQYLDACEAAGVIVGMLNIFRVRDLAVAA